MKPIPVHDLLELFEKGLEPAWARRIKFDSPLTTVERAERKKWYDKRYEAVDFKTPLNKILKAVTDIAGRLFTLFPEDENPDVLEEQQEFFVRLMFTAYKAVRKKKEVIQIFKTNKPPWGRPIQRVMQSATAIGLFRELASPPGSKKSSRLIITDKLQYYLPKERGPTAPAIQLAPYEFVERKVRKRAKKIEMVFNSETGEPEEKEVEVIKKYPAAVNQRHPVVKEDNKLLKKEHAVNSSFRFFYPEEDGPAEFWVQHVAKYIDNYKLCGRLCSHEDGHQQVPSEKRKEIWIIGGQGYFERGCCEFDFSATFITLCYHLDTLEAPELPYELWPTMNKGLRLAAKKMTNCILFTESRKEALLAFWKMLSAVRWDRNRKEWMARSGKKLNTALTIGRAIVEAGLEPRDVYNAVVETHEAVKGHFHKKDMGLKLMKLESDIARDVVRYFVNKGWPIMAIHDSFVVEVDKGAALRNRMEEYYYDRLGFMPRIKKVFRAAPVDYFPPDR
jgi:hypothetical protein